MRRSYGLPPARVLSQGKLGFCFGGTAALELARTGAPLHGVVSFHAGLETPNPSKNIKAQILVLHGADDPLVPEKEVAGFEQEMREGNTVWELTKYSGAVHSFTNPEAGSDNSKGFAYNARASARAYAAMSSLSARWYLLLQLR